MFQLKFRLDWSSSFGEENDNGWTNDGWTPEDGYIISSPCEPKSSSELNSSKIEEILVLVLV